MTEPSPENSATDARIRIGWWIGVLLSGLLVLYAETQRWQSFETEDTVGRCFDMLFSFNVDSTPIAILLLILPVCWFARRNVLQRQPRWLGHVSRCLSEAPGSEAKGAKRRAIVLSVVVAIVAFCSCVRVSQIVVDPRDGARFGDLPPAFHDEYSYLLQARTFLAGRWSFPSHAEVPRIFDQMHVLNEGQFASRYFPGTGLWISPFEAYGNPYLGHWVATVIACVCVFGIGRELSCNGVGLLAGLLAALAPGVVLFGNLLLAHQPTLAALAMFVFCFLRLQRRYLGTKGDGDDRHEAHASESSQRIRWIALRPCLLTLISGAGLAFAMLCRPMTAAAIGLPFGTWLAVWIIRHWRTDRTRVGIVVAGFAFPIAAGATVLLIQNHQITGDPFQSPYQVYTNLLTPRHMYGFNNVERAEPLQTNRVLTHYDQWAENLDASLALTNVRNRVIASGQWTLGLIPLLLSGCVLVIGDARRLDSRWWLIVAAIVSLHVLHVPYWFDGIMHWHYVFESSVLLCLVVSAATWMLFQWFREAQRPWMPMWWSALLLASVAVNHFAVPPFWGSSRLGAGVNELSFSRLQFDRFRQVVEASVDQTPALVLIRHNPDDRHIDYVSNHPGLSQPILFGRVPADAHTTEEQTLRAAAMAFEERSLYLAIAPRQIGQPWQFQRLR